jgi:hypothetical protein
MIFEYYDGTNWQEITSTSDNLFFGDLDGYTGETKEVFFRVKNETGDPLKRNFMARIVEMYNTTEYPLLPKTSGDLEVITKGGNPVIEDKISYSVRTDADHTIPGSGNDVIPDSNGMFLLGDLAADNGTITYSITTTAYPRVIADFGDSLKVSEIFFRYFSSSN